MSGSTSERFTPGSGTTGILRSETREASLTAESDVVDWGPDRIRPHASSSLIPPASHQTDELAHRDAIGHSTAGGHPFVASGATNNVCAVCGAHADYHRGA